MTIRPLASYLLVAIGLTMPAFVLAQSPDHGKQLTLTRGMLVFSELESRLASAVTGRDARSQAHLLAADFELRDAASPGRPLPRAEWLASKPYATTPPTLSQMAVHDYGTLAIVSFLLDHHASATETTDAQDFIVDVWQKQGVDWLLLVRYRSPTHASAARPKHPTGKE
jgi:hypothetical protein